MRHSRRTSKRLTQRRSRRALAIAAGVVVLLGSAACTSSGGDSPKTASKTKTSANTGFHTGIIGVDDSSAGTPHKGGTLTFGVLAATAGLDPVISQGTGSSGGNELAAIYDVLMRYEPSSDTYVPELAKSLDHDAKFSTWTLHLRPGVTFSDGTSFNSQAVKFSIERYISEKGRLAALAAIIGSIATPDAETAVFTLTSGWSDFPYLLGSGLGNIVSPTAVGKEGDKKFNTSPVGAGPFVVSNYVPGGTLTLRARSDYFGGAPYLDALKFVPLAGDSAKLDSLQTGEISAGYLNQPKFVAQALKAGYPGYEVVANAYGVLLLNNGAFGQKPATSNVEVRQAIAAAIDPQLIDKRVNDGSGLPGSALFLKASRLHTSAAGPKYDIAKAKSQLTTYKKSSGYDGALNLQCSNISQPLALTVQAELQAAGFKVKLNDNQTIAQEISTVIVKGNYDVACYGFDVDDAAPYAGLFQQLGNENNPSGYHNAEMTADLAELRTASTPAATEAAVTKIQQLFVKDVPGIVYGAAPVLTAWRKNVHGILPTEKQEVLFQKAWIAP